MSALDVVTHCVTLLEDDPLYNAGRGSVLNVDGDILFDASIMDGRSLDAGAIAGVRGMKNPVLLARAVMEKGDHVFLIGEGAEQFARKQGLAFEDAAFFLTEARVVELAEAKKRQAIVLDHAKNQEGKLGTVGAAARDRWGNLAARHLHRRARTRLAGASAIPRHRRRDIRRQRELRHFLHRRRRTLFALVARKDSGAVRRISRHGRRRSGGCGDTTSGG